MCVCSALVNSSVLTPPAEITIYLACVCALKHNNSASHLLNDWNSFALFQGTSSLNGEAGLRDVAVNFKGGQPQYRLLQGEASPLFSPFQPSFKHRDFKSISSLNTVSLDIPEEARQRLKIEQGIFEAYSDRLHPFNNPLLYRKYSGRWE